MKKSLNFTKESYPSEIESWQMIEEKSEELEVTCDYYLDEFYNI